MYQLGENFACPMEVSSVLEARMEVSSMFGILRVGDTGEVSIWAQRAFIDNFVITLEINILKADRTQNYSFVEFMNGPVRLTFHKGT